MSHRTPAPTVAVSWGGGCSAGGVQLVSFFPPQGTRGSVWCRRAATFQRLVFRKDHWIHSVVQRCDPFPSAWTLGPPPQEPCVSSTVHRNMSTDSEKPIWPLVWTWTLENVQIAARSRPWSIQQFSPEAKSHGVQLQVQSPSVLMFPQCLYCLFTSV